MENENEVFLESCFLDFQPDVSEQKATTLRLARNNINILNNEHFPRRCKVLDASVNRIRNDGIPLEWLASLEEIYLDENFIHDTEGVVWPPGLRLLSLSGNPLCDFPPDLPDSVETILCKNTRLNKITKLPSSLKHIALNGSSIYRIPYELPSTLRTFCANGNLLTTRSLPVSWGMSLRTLCLDDNKIAQFPQGLPNTVQHISLNRNRIKEIPDDLPADLLTMSLYQNRIQIIHYGQRKKPIEVVILNDNELICCVNKDQEKMEFRWANSIQELDNWNVGGYHLCANRIARAWKRYCLRKGMRQWGRMNKVRWELYAASMHPNRAGRFQNIDPQWNYDHCF